MLQRRPRASPEAPSTPHRLDGERPAPGRGAPWCAGARVAAGRSACQRAARVLRDAPVLPDDTPPAPQLGWQLWALRPGLDGASRPSTTLTRRRPTAGFRDGAPDRNRWGRQSRPFTSPPPAAHGSGSCAAILEDCNIPAAVHGFRSTFRDWAAGETDHPREFIEAALAHVVGNKVEAAYARSDLFERRRRLMDDWEAYLPASARGRRHPPGGPNDSMRRRSRPRATPRGPCARNAGSGGSRANGSGRQPAVAWVSSTSHATTALGRPRAVGCDPRRRVIVTLSTATASSCPAARPLLTACQVERLACTHSRPIRPRSGYRATRSERRLRRRGGRRPRPDLEMRSGLYPAAVKGDGHGMGGEPLPLRRRTRPA